MSDPHEKAAAVAAALMLAACAMPGPAGAEAVFFRAADYVLADYYQGPPNDYVQVTVSNGTATFAVSGDYTANFSIPEGITPVADSGGAPTFQVGVDDVTGDWDATTYPYIGFYSSSFGGGLSIGESSDLSGPFLVNLFQSYAGGPDQLFSYSAIPEPGVWVTLGLGVGATGAGLRRRKRLAAA